jgi:hypothetical protein
MEKRILFFAVGLRDDREERQGSQRKRKEEQERWVLEPAGALGVTDEEKEEASPNSRAAAYGCAA